MYICTWKCKLWKILSPKDLKDDAFSKINPSSSTLANTCEIGKLFSWVVEICTKTCELLSWLAQIDVVEELQEVPPIINFLLLLSSILSNE